MKHLAIGLGAMLVIGIVVFFFMGMKERIESLNSELFHVMRHDGQVSRQLAMCADSVVTTTMGDKYWPDGEQYIDVEITRRLSSDTTKTKPGEIDKVTITMEKKK